MYGTKYGSTSESDLIPSDGTEVIEITRKKKQKEPFPGYTIFGNGKTTRNGGESMDILDICQQLNTGEMKLMQFFRDEIELGKALSEDNPNKVVPTRCTNWNNYLKIALKKNFAHMECLGVLKRMKRGTYMLNPKLFIPPKSIRELDTIWDSISTSKDKEGV